MLPTTILVWAYVVYSVFDFNNPQSSSGKKSEKVLSDEPFNSTLTDTFSLLLNYNDPFLKEYKPQRISVNKNSTGVKPKTVAPVVVKVNDSEKWPAIVFSGKISSNKDDKQLCIMKVDGTDYIVAKGQQAGEVSVIDVYNDSVLVAYKGNKKTFLKNK